MCRFLIAQLFGDLDLSEINNDEPEFDEITATDEEIRSLNIKGEASLNNAVAKKSIIIINKIAANSKFCEVVSMILVHRTVYTMMEADPAAAGNAGEAADEASNRSFRMCLHRLQNLGIIQINFSQFKYETKVNSLLGSTFKCQMLLSTLAYYQQEKLGGIVTFNLVTSLNASYRFIASELQHMYPEDKIDDACVRRFKSFMMKLGDRKVIAAGLKREIELLESSLAKLAKLAQKPPKKKSAKRSDAESEEAAVDKPTLRSKPKPEPKRKSRSTSVQAALIVSDDGPVVTTLVSTIEATIFNPQATPAELFIITNLLGVSLTTNVALHKMFRNLSSHAFLQYAESFLRYIHRFEVHDFVEHRQRVSLLACFSDPTYDGNWITVYNATRDRSQVITTALVTSDTVRDIVSNIINAHFNVVKGEEPRALAGPKLYAFVLDAFAHELAVVHEPSQLTLLNAQKDIELVFTLPGKFCKSEPLCMMPTQHIDDAPFGATNTISIVNSAVIQELRDSLYAEEKRSYRSLYEETYNVMCDEGQTQHVTEAPYGAETFISVREGSIAILIVPAALKDEVFRAMVQLYKKVMAKEPMSSGDAQIFKNTMITIEANPVTAAAFGYYVMHRYRILLTQGILNTFGIRGIESDIVERGCSTVVKAGCLYQIINTAAAPMLTSYIKSISLTSDVVQSGSPVYIDDNARKMLLVHDTIPPPADKKDSAQDSAEARKKSVAEARARTHTREVMGMSSFDRIMRQALSPEATTHLINSMLLLWNRRDPGMWSELNKVGTKNALKETICRKCNIPLVIEETKVKIEECADQAKKCEEKRTNATLKLKQASTAATKATRAYLELDAADSEKSLAEEEMNTAINAAKQAATDVYTYNRRSDLIRKATVSLTRYLTDLQNDHFDMRTLKARFIQVGELSPNDGDEEAISAHATYRLTYYLTVIALLRARISNWMVEDIFDQRGDGGSDPFTAKEKAQNDKQYADLQVTTHTRIERRVQSEHRS
jgi:hypothetical protein